MRADSALKALVAVRQSFFLLIDFRHWIAEVFGEARAAAVSAELLEEVGALQEGGLVSQAAREKCTSVTHAFVKASVAMAQCQLGRTLQLEIAERDDHEDFVVFRRAMFSIYTHDSYILAACKERDREDFELSWTFEEQASAALVALRDKIEKSLLEEELRVVRSAEDEALSRHQAMVEVAEGVLQRQHAIDRKVVAEYVQYRCEAHDAMVLSATVEAERQFHINASKIEVWESNGKLIADLCAGEENYKTKIKDAQQEAKEAEDKLSAVIEQVQSSAGELAVRLKHVSKVRMGVPGLEKSDAELNQDGIDAENELVDSQVESLKVKENLEIEKKRQEEAKSMIQSQQQVLIEAMNRAEEANQAEAKASGTMRQKAKLIMSIRERVLDAQERVGSLRKELEAASSGGSGIEEGVVIDLD